MKTGIFKRWWAVHLTAIVCVCGVVLAGLWLSNQKNSTGLTENASNQTGNSIGINNSPQQMCITIQGGNNPDCPQQEAQAQTNTKSSTSPSGSSSESPSYSSGSHSVVIPPITNYLGEALNNAQPAPTPTYVEPTWPSLPTTSCKDITLFGSTSKMYQCPIGTYPAGSCKDVTIYPNTYRYYDCR